MTAISLRTRCFMLQFIPLTLCVVTLASCGSTGLITSLDDLTAHVSQEGLLDLQQQRLLSLSGLIPNAAPGSIFRYDGDRSPFTSIGISTLPPKQPVAQTPQNSPQDGTEDDDQSATADPLASVSYVHQRTIKNQLGLPELVAIRDQLINVRRLASELIHLRLRRLTETQDDVPKSPLRLSTRTISQVQAEFNEALKQTTESIQQPGLMVLRAETTANSSLSAKLGEILGLQSNKQESKAGFALLAGLRTSFLFVGTDLKEQLKYVSHDWTLVGRKFPFILGASWVRFMGLPIPLIYPGQLSRDDYYIVTSRLEAEYILYAQDSVVEREIQANLEATIDQLSQIEALSKTEELQIDAILASVESLGSLGILGLVEEENKPMLEAQCTWAKAGPDATILGRQAEDASWQTVYAIMSEIDDLDILVSRHPRLHLTGIF